MVYGIIYMVKNIANGKIYVGQTTESLATRRRKHIAKKDSSYFHNAIKKYGIGCFIWSIIDTADGKEELSRKEKFHILDNKANTKAYGYNLTTGGEGTRVNDETKEKLRKANTGKKHTQETIEKLRKSHIGNPGYWTGKKLPDHVVKMMIGRKPSEESRIKNSQAHIGKTPWNKGKRYKMNSPVSDITRKKISIAAKAQWDRYHNDKARCTVLPVLEE
jgi:group I intron endonuclease